MNRPSSSQAGFTMVEIAICIAIVSFAMVAIIGVMPTGFRVQKDNREETIINQEGNFWLEAIRGGSLGLDYLTNYVERIHAESASRRPNETKFRQFVGDYGYGTGFTNGLEILGLLSLPRYYQQGGFLFRNTSLFAYTRAITGSAAEKSPHNDFAFMYRLTPEILPFDPVAGLNTNFTATGLPAAEVTVRSNLWLKARSTQMHLYQVKLTLEWPVYPSQKGLVTGSNRKVFRTLVSGSYWVNTNATHLPLRETFFLQPSEHISFR
jgi:prepilin-type N-terminal cleavage/methylation domain-containing protein